MNTASKLAIAATIAVVALASLLISVRAQQPDYTTQCSNGVAVSDPQNNPSLVQDCAALLAARDAFAADPPLNWSPDTSIHDWEGITLESTLVGSYFRNRVVEIYLWGDGLTGSISPELGNLTNLQGLGISNNQLTGSIPPELGNLTNLIWLTLDNNQLTGSIPPELGNLAYLDELDLSRNQLTGSIPPELGNLTNLRQLMLANNELTGSIPPELGNLAHLYRLLLSGNQLTGCIPVALSDLSYNDFGSLGLPLCDTADTTPTPTPTPPPPPRPTATPTPASTATPIAPTVPTEVLNRLSALETVVASLEGRIAALEADPARPEPTPTPTLTPTPTPNTGVPPTETPTPSPTPQSVVEACVQAIPIDGVVSLVNGNWSADCEASSPSPEGGVRYARYYTFTLSAPFAVTIDLISDADTYLYLKEGGARDGVVILENDDIDADARIFDSRIQADLQSGSYTIEATTYKPQIVADFQITLTIR